MSEVGLNIRKARKVLGLNQTIFAQPLNLSQNHLAAIENGKRTLTDRTLKDLEREYRIRKDFILTGEGEMFYSDKDELKLESYLESICEDEDKRDWIIKTYLMYLELDENDQKLIRALIESLLLKKHP